jgi:hypothetical protein
LEELAGEDSIVGACGKYRNVARMEIRLRALKGIKTLVIDIPG